MIFKWGHERRYNAYSNYAKSVFGGRIQKVSLDAGFTCPNRDGTISSNGCIYCNNKGFNPSYCDSSTSIHHQLDEGIMFLSKRYDPDKYLAYFQAYSNTYASLDDLKRKYETALSHPKIEGLVIGTRPDCIDNEKLDYLERLAKDNIIVLEYGIESCYNKTLKAINRGHTFEQTVEAIQMTVNRGIHIGGHLIFGLPYETIEEMLNEAEIISALPLDSIKFHQLQIVKDTTIEKIYYSNPEIFHLFTLDEYIDFIIEFLERLTPKFIVQRLLGEAPPSVRIAPNWGNLRMDVITNMIEKKLEEKNTFQGRLFKTSL